MGIFIQLPTFLLITLPPGRDALPAELHGRERVKGIEPSSLAWKARALPLSYTRNYNSGPGWIRTTVGVTPADLQSAAINHSATDP